MTYRDVLRCELARRDFWEYCKLLAPDFYCEDRQFLKNKCREYQDFYESPDEYLIDNEPPRHGKSRTATLFVQWVIGKCPKDKIITGSYNETLSTVFSKGVRNKIQETSADGGVIVWIVADATINGSETGTSFRQALYFMDCGFNLHDTMIWQKISPFQHKNRYISSFEYMFVFSKAKPKTTNIICDRKNKHGGQTIHGTERRPDGTTRQLSGAKNKRKIKEYGQRYNVWDIPPNRYNKTGHPATFPEQLANDHIISWSNEGDTVLDCFMGSGTTGKMAVLNNRNFIGIELDKGYFEIAKKRIEESWNRRADNG